MFTIICTPHDMTISNISLQYKLEITYNLTHSILLVLVLFLKIFRPFLEKSTRHFKTENL